MPAGFATPTELADGIQNIEALCTRCAGNYLSQRQATLPTDAFEDLVSYLMLAAWTEAARYRSVGGTSSLNGFISTRLAFRCTDWYRSRFGRSRLPKPVILSLDQLHAAELLEPDCA